MLHVAVVAPERSNSIVLRSSAASVVAAAVDALGSHFILFLAFWFQVAPAIINAVTLVNGTAASESKLPLIVVAFAAADGAA